MPLQRRLAVLALLTALVAQPAPAGAVIIRDDTWAANGGSKTRWSAGFGPAVALAAQAQFASVVSLGGCSGTWLGNDENDHAFVLTAAHCFVEVSASEKGATVVNENDPWIATTDEGTQLREIARTIHPRYDQTDEFAPGFDMAILEFDGPIEDCGDAPVLYSGSDEVGYAATLVGYGTRGTARHQEGEKFTADSDASKAAATNVVDAAVEAQATGPLGNDLQIDFDDPDGGSNALEGTGCPPMRWKASWAAATAAARSGSRPMGDGGWPASTRAATIRRSPMATSTASPGFRRSSTSSEPSSRTC